jgi:WD40 repeat protein
MRSRTNVAPSQGRFTNGLPLAILALSAMSLLIPLSAQAAEDQDTASESVSYYEQIRPIFQAHCQGCHQPAKRGGDYVMTDFDMLLTEGESGSQPIVAGKPEESYLMEQIVVSDGVAEMPKDKPPLSTEEIDLIKQWISEGAKNDTPATATTRFDAEHPPTYPSLPVVTSIAYSPSGEYLAVSGYHEVLLHRIHPPAEEGQPWQTSLAGRLIGISERIESVSFSPTGDRLAVASGSPGRFGEVQIWDVDSKTLTLSKLEGFDTLYGVSWSSDGKLLAFGCPDNTIRAIDPLTGEQKLFNGAHDDWVLDTIFSVNNDHLISVSRDRSMKLVNVETERFIDNITSITPGVLKGGLNAVDRHPEQDQLLAGGADGIPKIYKMLREQARKIGDDFNLIRAFPQIEGRIMDVSFSPDGQSIAVCSSVDGHGFLRIDKTEDGSTLVSIPSDSSGLYSLDFSPNGQQIAVGGFDGWVRVYAVTDGQLLLEFPAAPLNEPASTSTP